MSTSTTTRTDWTTDGCGAFAASLDAWLDRELDGDDLAAFDLHRRGCEACAGVLARATAVSRWASALPEAEPPPTDLWPGVLARIEAASASAGRTDPADTGPGPEGPARGGWRTQLRPLAALLLVAVGSSVGTALVLRATPPAAPGDLDGPENPALAPADAADQWERDVRTATADLTAALAERRAEIDPDTLAIVERNLAIIDQAIEETREALDATPDDPRVRDAMLTAYNQKIRVLQHALRLPRT